MSRTSRLVDDRSAGVPHPHRRLASPRPSLTAWLGAAALFLVGALPAAAQDNDPLAKLDARSRYQVELTIDSAETLGIPTRPLLLKAMEGIAKRAANPQIVTEVKRKFALLRTARAALGPVDENELDAATSVLDAGAKPDQLAEFRVRQKDRSDVSAFAIWADFIKRGVPKDEAFSAINKLWHDGADDATFQNLWKNVQADILQGLNPGTALQNRIRQGPTRVPGGPGKPPEGSP